MTMIKELSGQVRTIDNFYDNPDEIRALALGAKYKTPLQTERGNGVALGARCCARSYDAMVSQFGSTRMCWDRCW